MLSSVPISGTATMPSHSRMTGVEISISSCRCRATTSSLSLSSTTTAATRSEPISSVTASSSAGTVAAPGSLSNIAVSGIQSCPISSMTCCRSPPDRSRSDVMRDSTSRTMAKLGARTSSARPDPASSTIASTSRMAAANASSCWAP